ncbi:conserved hypothetical protein [Sanguibacter gelidistatuariae]|uniref:Purine nucleoside phosphorylase n=1 Tax=Sanguibacter gelidistatuariae TaxID=1814289 RepID=A0A1G6NXV2_9MICO|nr:peptidoglycan editing factor PgeF [Sanguibacter gelidistatuariae]SDC72860.1 conserved hypothetical protein [Sanguibacter gelidistatuariae]
MGAPTIPVLEVDLGPGIRAFFTTRHGGLSEGPWASLNLGLGVGDTEATVRANRRLVDAVAGAPVNFATQVHGRDIAVASASLASAPAPEVDALVTSEVGVPLGVYVADCVPVLLADPRAGVVAVAHAGRPGVEMGVVGAAVEAMLACGGRARDLRAVVGPAVCGDCYEVPADLAARVGERVPSALSQTSWGTPALDLPRAVTTQLALAGVAHVERIHRCTRTDPAFFSHRRSSADALPAGRFAGVVLRA